MPVARQQLGELADRVTVQEYSRVGEGPDATEEWIDVITREFAKVRAIGADERLQAQAIGARIGYHVFIRYRTGIEAKQRIVWHADGGDRTLEILGAFDLDGHRRYLQLDCSEAAE